MLFFSLEGQTPLMPVLHQASSKVAVPAAQTQDLTILALRVAFTTDQNPSTTGDGSFLMELSAKGSARCDGLPGQGFLVDPPPHTAAYFNAQLQAVANYYRQVSGGHVTFDLDGSRVYPPDSLGPVVLGPMAGYRSVADEDSSDALLVKLFAESVAAAAVSGILVASYNLVVVFHAGLGQDFTYPGLDPTPLDIPSAYIDSAMIAAARNTYGVPVPPDVKGGLLLPEGQNHIYYDIIEDIFPGADSYCQLQVGLTGTFALLIGYALGLPPLYDVDDGVTGVGVFGLMDVGSNNGQGVIPAPPTAWTRVFMGWETADELEGDIALAARHLPDGRIGRISLGGNEYFLVENRVGPVQPEAGFDFDYLVDSVGVDTAHGVIISVPNYDLGLPGSGLLIWHVDQSRYNDAMQGINNDPEARAVALEEADGAVDIGFPTTAIFADPTQGWLWDMWYAGNEGFFTANPDRLADNQLGLLGFDHDTYPSTHLNSGAESGIAVSMIGAAGDALTFRVEDEDVTRLPEGSRLLGFNGEKLIYTTIDFLGLADSLWLDEKAIGSKEGIAPVTFVVSEFDPVTEPAGNSFWVIEAIPENYLLWHSPRPWYSARRYTGAGILTVEITDTVQIEGASFDEGLLFLQQPGSAPPPSPDSVYLRYTSTPDNRYDTKAQLYLGYLHDTEYRSAAVMLWAPNITEPSTYTYVLGDSNDALALGDLDGDGLDEIVSMEYLKSLRAFSARKGMLFMESGITVDGFPVTGRFTGPILIANLEGDIRPELVVVESGDIAIYSPEGQPLTRLGLHAKPGDLFLMHTGGDSVGLANGDRIHWFHPDEQNPQWVTPQGRHSRSRCSLNDGQHTVDQPAVLDRSRVYNYPNPVTDGSTTIRFYTGQASRATIRIYTVDGFPVVQTELTDLATNDYNEWVWDVGDQPSGLYYAVVEVEGAGSAGRQTAMVKIAVVR